MSHTPVAFLLTSHKARYLPRETTHIRLYCRDARSRSLVRGQQIFAGYLSTG